ncbi:MAG TPA: hypothetical protein VIG25_09590 [Pyrinomonadaceae bacterium]
MIRSISSLLCLAIIGICFITSCGQTPENNKLIDEINGAKIKARNLGEEAERKRTKARDSGDRNERHRLIEEAATLYGHASDTLFEAAKNASEMAKVKRPTWYEEYFQLQSKLINNLAQLAAGAHEELLARDRGEPSESQVQSWRENINRIKKENEEFRRQITAIESRQGIVLIKE